MFLQVTSAPWKGRVYFVSTHQNCTPASAVASPLRRALTGSQASGDAYVVATVESLIASPKNAGIGVEFGGSASIACSRKLWEIRVPVNGKPDAGEIVLPPEQAPHQITPRRGRPSPS